MRAEQSGTPEGNLCPGCSVLPGGMERRHESNRVRTDEREPARARESQQRDDRGSTGPPQRPCQSCLDWSSGSGPWRPLFPPALPAVVLVSQARPKSDPRQVRADDVTRCKSSQLQLGKLCDPDDDSGGRPLFAGPRQARQRRAVNFSGRSTMQDAG